MNDARRELLAILAELSEAAPDVRFGQLVTNLSYIARGLSNDSVYEVEDEELLVAAREHLEQWRSLGRPNAGRPSPVGEVG